MKLTENKIRDNFSLGDTNIEMNDLSQGNDIMNINLNNATTNLKRFSTGNITNN